MKKYAKNLGKMMLPYTNANAGPPFYPPTRFFAKAKVGELAINKLIK